MNRARLLLGELVVRGVLAGFAAYCLAMGWIDDVRAHVGPRRR